uniref:phage portal protein family protein n=1 Tax=uncultured Draconibacterium sp. TaxID=1573823 RepID=UPI00321707CD
MAQVERKSGKTVKPIIIQNLDIRQVNRQTQDIGKWRNAMKAAESITNPNRSYLYDMYEDIELDAQLINCTDTRTRKITNSKLMFSDEHGKVIDQVQNLIHTKTFFNMLGDLFNTRTWGYSLLNFSMLNGALNYDLIDRRHVKPKQGIVVQRPGDMSGVDYTKPPYNKYTIAAGKPDDLGLYLSVAQYVIYKRGGFGDWAQFAEIFGMPFRVGKYDGHDTTTRAQLNQALETMGSAAYASIPRNTDIEIQQNNNNGNGDVYEKLKNACDEQIAIRMLGQTMTSKDGSSLSQAQVHYEVAEDVHKDDRTFILNYLNDDLKKILTTFGFPTNGTFSFVDEKKLTLKDRIAIDDKLSKHIVLTPEYWHETYGIDMPDNYAELVAEKERKEKEKAEAKAASAAGLSPSQGDRSKATGGNVRTPIKATYNPPIPPANILRGFNPFAAANKAKVSKADFKAMQKEAKRLATLIYEGQLPADYYVSETMVELIAGHLRSAVESGYGNLASFAADSADAATIKQLNDNIYRFSAAKNYNMLQDLNAALLNSKGERVSLNDFNRAVENLNLEYNRRWQETEYNTAQASSQMASKYNQYQNEAEAVPMLIFKTAGDEHVRASHRPLDGMTAPANDPVWQKIWPPLDWGCRCDVIQHESDDVKRNVPEAEHLPIVGKGFEGNSAATGEIFDKNHPYFKGVPEEVAKKIFG